MGSDYPEFINTVKSAELVVSCYGDISITIDNADISQIQTMKFTFAANDKIHYEVCFKYIKGYLTIVSKKSSYVDYTV